MPDEIDALLRLVSEGKITAEEAAPILAALDEKARGDSRASREAGSGGAGSAGGSPQGRHPSAREALSARRIVVFVAEDGHPIVNLAIPLAAAGFAIDQVPGLSPDHRSRIVEAIQGGITGPILEVSDHGDEVRIVIE
jgi:hypothetical protein